MNGTHFSYPDFILKDIYDRIHIFEVKSVNEGAMGVGFDANSYEEKTIALKHCYLYASKLTKHIFYLPIKEECSWKIIRLMDGEESIITKEQLKEFMISEL